MYKQFTVLWRNLHFRLIKSYKIKANGTVFIILCSSFHLQPRPLKTDNHTQASVLASFNIGKPRRMPKRSCHTYAQTYKELNHLIYSRIYLVFCHFPGNCPKSFRLLCAIFLFVFILFCRVFFFFGGWGEFSVGQRQAH